MQALLDTVLFTRPGLMIPLKAALDAAGQVLQHLRFLITCQRQGPRCEGRTMLLQIF